MPRPNLLRPLVCALAFSLVAGLASPSADAQRRKSKAPEVPTPACTDFYAFANEAWLLANPLPEGSGSISALQQLSDHARTQQLELLNAAMQSPQGSLQLLLGDFWASGLDEASIERDGAQPVAPLLERINAIRRAKDIVPAIAALHQVGIPVAFNFSADIDLDDADRHIGYFTQGGLGLPDPAYYTRTDEDARALLGQYNAYVQKMLALTGTPQKDLAQQAQLVIDLETRIAQAARPPGQLRDPRQNHAPVAVADLAGRYKRLQLAEFLKAQGVEDDTVSIANPAMFEQLDTLVGEIKPAQWQAYLRWRVGDTMAPYMARAWRDASFDFRGRVLAGQAAPPPRTDFVLDAINRAAGPMLGREYAAQHLTGPARTQATAVAEEVRAALARALAVDARLSPEARAEALAKLQALVIEIGTPRRDLDFTLQPMGRGSFGGNMLIASTWAHREEMRRIGKGNADRRWDVLPQQPALAYDVAHNRLVVTAAMLQPPVFDPAQPLPAQYGAFGALVGHELSHGFDTRGRMVAADRQLRDWWGQQESSAWEATANRVAAQVGNLDYPALTGTRLNGSQTRDENVADLAGVELAWDAFQAAQPEGDPESRQAFFRGWAALWPQHLSPEAAGRLAAGSVHSPGVWRTNVPLMNSPGFGETFDCKAGTPMQLKAEEQVSLWR
ncbi:MAG: M13 family metallopeptidase [Pseudomonadota bacterium]|nr:M13 family metallopeptidase [Pseudomonadota bacterium]